MRIEGIWGADAPFLRAFLICEKLGIKDYIIFLVDTGATSTNILDRDAIRLRIDYSKLKRVKDGTTGIGGVVDTYILPQVKLYFRAADGSLHEEKLKELSVLRHVPKDRKEEEHIKRLPSLLGRDFLNRYKVILDRSNDRVTLTDEPIP